MPTAQLIDVLASGLRTSAGAAVASGKVRFYAPGTLTPISVYSDEAGSSAISQPLTLTAGGTGIAYTTVPCRVLAKDSTDTTTLFDENVGTNVDGSIYVVSPSFNGGSETLLSTILDAVDDSFGGTDWKYKHAASATERNLKSWMGEVHISVKDYGALGDDANDDTAEIQAAFDAAAAAGTNVYFPPGTYRITSAITMPSSSITVRGIPWASIIKNMSTTGHVFTCSTENVTGQFIGIKITANTTSTGYAFNYNFGALILDHVNVELHRRCVNSLETTLRPSVVCTASILTAANEASGLCVTADSATILTANLFTSVHNSSTAVTLSSPLGSVVTGNQFSGNSGTAIAATGTASVIISGNSFVWTGTRISTASTANSVIDVGNAANSSGSASVNADARTGSPLNFALTTTTSVTPLPSSSPLTRIVQSTGSTTVTINAAADAMSGTHHTIMCVNASGGSVTWTFDASWHTSAAVAPTTGNRVTLEFVYEKISDAWYEVARATTAT